MARVIRSEQAQQDLEGILDYLDSPSTQAADRFATEFDQTCDLPTKFLLNCFSGRVDLANAAPRFSEIAIRP